MSGGSPGSQNQMGSRGGYRALSAAVEIFGWSAPGIQGLVALIPLYSRMRTSGVDVSRLSESYSNRGRGVVGQNDIRSVINRLGNSVAQLAPAST